MLLAVGLGLSIFGTNHLHLPMVEPTEITHTENLSGSGVKVGSAAPEFKLKNVDGKMISLADYKKDAKGVVVIFSCNHCPYVIKYEDRMNEISKKYKAAGFPMVCINPNDAKSHPEDSFDKMVERHREKGFTFAYLHDETQEIAKKYGAEKTPHVYLLNKDAKGNFKVAYIGAIDDNPGDASAVKEKYLENAINSLLAGKELSVKETKAIGCSIKWKK